MRYEALSLILVLGLAGHAVAQTTTTGSTAVPGATTVPGPSTTSGGAVLEPAPSTTTFAVPGGLRPGVNTLEGVPFLGTSPTAPPGTAEATVPAPAAGTVTAGAGMTAGSVPANVMPFLQGLATANVATQRVTTSVMMEAGTLLHPVNLQAFVNQLNTNPAALANARLLTAQLRAQRTIGADETVIGFNNGRVLKVKAATITPPPPGF